MCIRDRDEPEYIQQWRRQQQLERRWQGGMYDTGGIPVFIGCGSVGEAHGTPCMQPAESSDSNQTTYGPFPLPSVDPPPRPVIPHPVSF
eukprot:5938876-Karenia_brevis.AAC.1